MAAGVVDRASGRPLAPGAAFRIASVTKTFTAAAVLRLAEEGKVDLDASITGYVSAQSIAILQADGYAMDAAMDLFRLSGSGLTCWLHSGTWGVMAIYCP